MCMTSFDPLYFKKVYNVVDKSKYDNDDILLLTDHNGQEATKLCKNYVL